MRSRVRIPYKPEFFSASLFATAKVAYITAMIFLHIAKILSNSWQQAKPFTPCAARTIIFQRENLNYLIVYFTQSTLFFRKVCFLFQICLPCVFCGTYVTKINAVWWTEHTADIRVSCLVYVRTYCVPIATLNQNKRTRLLVTTSCKPYV